MTYNVFGGTLSLTQSVNHITHYGIAESSMMHANFMALSFIEPELLPMEVLHCGNGII